MKGRVVDGFGDSAGEVKSVREVPLGRKGDLKEEPKRRVFG
ncbi:MAG: hypothetical protein ACTS6P_01060 [Candidatus Hodgkinia cicadicola]